MLNAYTDKGIPGLGQRLRLIVLVLLVAVGGCLAFSRAASAAQVSLLTKFPAGTGCCAIAANNTGNVYVGLSGGRFGSGQILSITPSGAQHELFSTPPPVAGGIGPVGLAIGPGHQFYLNDANYPVAKGAVYRIRRNGSATLVPGSDRIALPDGVALDSEGNLYITDDLIGGQGLVWRVTPGGTAQVWSADPALFGGANSIQIIGDDAYVSVTGAGTMVKIPIEANGSAGRATVIASDPAIAPVDDGAYDPRTGDVYLTSLMKNVLVKITPTGATSVIADAQTNALYTPTNLALVQKGDSDGQDVLYVVGSAIPSYGAPPGSRPEVLKVNLK